MSSQINTCRHCLGRIIWIASSTPELGGDWWHCDAFGATVMTCGVNEEAGTTLMDFAEPV